MLTTHCKSSCEKCRAALIDGKATLMIDASRMIISCAMLTSPKVSQGRVFRCAGCSTRALSFRMLIRLSCCILRGTPTVVRREKAVALAVCLANRLLCSADSHVRRASARYARGRPRQSRIAAIGLAAVSRRFRRWQRLEAMSRRPRRIRSWPPVAAQIHSSTQIERDSLRFEHLALQRTARTDAACRVDDPLPRHAILPIFRHLIQGIADHPRVAAAHNRGYIAIRRH